MFVTTQYLLLDAGSGAVQLTDGGHIPPLWYHQRTGEVETLDLAGGPPLGVLPEASYPETTLQLEHGDSLLLLTDGVSERTNEAGEAFGLPRLSATVRAAGRSGASFIRPVLQAVEAFTAGGRHRDDLTLVQLTWC